MKLSEYIQELESLLKSEGDIPVKTFWPSGEFRDANKPKIGFDRKLVGRQQKNKGWRDGDQIDLKGDKFIHI